MTKPPHRHDRRRRTRRSIEGLRSALRAPVVNDQDRFDALLAGWIELGEQQLVELSLLFVGNAGDGGAIEDPGEGFARVLRLVDVVGRRPDGTYALLVDAGADGAQLVAERIVATIGAGGPRRVAVGVVTVAPAGASASEVLAVAAAALGRAAAHPDGGIEAVSV